MPIKLIPPRQGKTPYWYMRGSHLRISVYESCGTDRRSVARKVRDARERAIERGEWPVQAAPRVDEPTFLSAAVRYMEAGRRPKYLAKIIKHFGLTPLKDIDQAAIDDAAAALYPNVTPATRNVCVYTPISAVLHFNGIDITLRRPKGAKGRVVTDSLTPADAAGIITCAQSFDPEYALLLKFLLYTGCRIGEALALRWEDVRLEDGAAWIRESKNEDPRELKLRGDLVTALRGHPRPNSVGRIFRFHQGGYIKHKLARARMMHLGIPCPVRRPVGWKQPPHRLAWVNHHSFRHTWATWMRRYGGLDVQGLVATKNWRDPRSAARYAHAVAREEWKRVENLPGIGGPDVERDRDAG